MKRVVTRAVLGLLIAAAILPLVGQGTAGAALAAPVLVGPADGATVGVNPVFTWSAVAGAPKYRIQVSDDPAFGTLKFTRDTVNLAATAEADLPNTTLYWHVAGIDAANAVGPYSVTRSFTKTVGGLGQPTPIAPLDSSPPIQYPNQPVAFSWQPLPNSKSYTIEIDDDADFTPPLIATENTTNPIYTWSSPTQMNKTLYWHVRATSPANITSGWSDVQAFSVSWSLRPELVYPPNDPNNPFVLEEVRFDWDGGVGNKTVPGATRYDLQLSSDVNFNTIVHSANDLEATAYTPPTTFPASAYYWRVRAKNAVNAVGEWSDVGVFQRTWPTTQSPNWGYDTVTLISPANNAVTIEPNLRWSPSRLAGRYELWISADPNFTPGSVFSCSTNHTTVTPYSPGCGINLAIGTTYHWKVLPIDTTTNIEGVFSNTRTFIYNPQADPPTGPGFVNYIAPSEGFTFAANQPPVLQWDPVFSTAVTPITSPETAPAPDQTGFGRYQVEILKGVPGVPFSTHDTYNTQIVPPLTFDPGPTTTYRWRVIVRNSAGVLGLAGPFRTFTITRPNTVLPFTVTSAAGLSGVNPPLLTWNSVYSATLALNAVRYDVFYGVRGTNIFNAIPLNSYQIKQNGYAHLGVNLTTGQYDFKVRAYNNAGGVIGDSNVSWFEIKELTSPGISPVNLTAPPDCKVNPACVVQADTPTLDWDPVPRATFYIVELATDVNFTNVLTQYTSTTYYTKLTLVASLPDNQAGGDSYYWFARPCTGVPGNARCAPSPSTYAALPSCYQVPNLVPGTPCSPIRAFIKKSHQIQMVSPTPPPYLPDLSNVPLTLDEITFHWEDYLKTNRNTNPIVDQEASKYRVTVATTNTFQAGTVLDTFDLDATRYTDRTLYPDGPLFWKVQAIDASNNLLPGPVAPGRITKQAPFITPSAPANNAVVTEVPVLQWPAQSYALNYQVEVYKNPDSGPQAVNRVVSATTVTNAYAPRIGLPAGEYGWRVKYKDAGNNDARWSDVVSGLRRFTVAPNGVNLIAPPDAALVAGNRALFTWTQATGPFGSYRFELSSTPAFTTLAASQVTVTPGFAPSTTYSNGTWYWRVLTLDGNNNVLAVSTPAYRQIVIGQPGVEYHPITPTRMLDSRNPLGPWGGTKLTTTPRSLLITGGVVPGTATAIIANITATGGSNASFLTVYPADQNKPVASNVNFAAGQTIPNLATVKLGAGGDIKIANQVGSVDVIVDVVGYFDDGSGGGDRFTGVSPTRLLDSREATSPWGNSPLPAGSPRTLQVSGSQGLPSDITAAVMNVTVTGSTQPSFLTVYPGPGATPNVSNLNFSAGETIPNLVVVPLNSSGQATFATAAGNTDVIVDVVGFFGPGGDKFHFMSPTRILDSRLNTNDPANANWNTTKLGTIARPLKVAGVSSIPLTATSVVMNTTVTGGTANSFLTLYPAGASLPNSSNLNFAAGQTIPNLVMVKLGTGGANGGVVNIKNANGSVDVIGDVVGYFAAQ